MGWHEDENLPEEGKEQSILGAHKPWQSSFSWLSPEDWPAKLGWQENLRSQVLAEQSNAPHHVTHGCSQLFFKKATWNTGEKSLG